MLFLPNYIKILPNYKTILQSGVSIDVTHKFYVSIAEFSTWFSNRKEHINSHTFEQGVPLVQLNVSVK